MYMVKDKGPVSVFWMWISGFLNTFYWFIEKTLLSSCMVGTLDEDELTINE